MAATNASGFGEQAIAGDTWTQVFAASGGIFGDGVRSIFVGNSAGSANALFAIPVYTDDPGDPEDGVDGSAGVRLDPGQALELAAVARSGGRIAKLFVRSVGATATWGVSIL